MYRRGGVKLHRMLHGHIVDMIDACLERLHTARRLLTPSRGSLAIEDLLKVSTNKSVETKKKVRPAIRIKKTRRDELTPNLFSEAPGPVAEASVPTPKTHSVKASSVAQHVAEAPWVEKVVVQQTVVVAAPKAVAEDRAVVAAPRKKTPPPASALVHHVPAQPVFIPASQVRKEYTQTKAEKAAASQPAAAPLTAEMLARRWIQSADL